MIVKNRWNLALAATLLVAVPAALRAQVVSRTGAAQPGGNGAASNTVSSLPPIYATPNSPAVQCSARNSSDSDGDLYGWLMAADGYDDQVSLASAMQPAPADSQPVPAAPATNQPAPSPRRRAAANQFATGGSVSSLGGPQAPASMSPNMIGDFFVGSGSVFFTSRGKATQNLGSIPTAGGTRRVKISENMSPIPRDRVFFDYNDFQNALLVPGFGGNAGYSTSVQRYMPGFEKTFFNGWSSIDVRAPFANAQNPNINTIAPSTPAKATVFGNMTVTLKTLLVRTDRLAIAGGFGLNLPSAASTQVTTDFGGIPLRSFTIQNNAVHIMPYVGVLFQPTDRIVVQGYTQVDVGANGNLVYDNTNKTQVGKLNDQTLLYVDASIAYWVYRNSENRYLTGIVPTLEYHFTGSLQKPDQVSTADGFSFGSPVTNLDISNMTVGSHFYIGPKAILTVAGVLPLNRSANERQFDSELVAFFNRYF